MNFLLLVCCLIVVGSAILFLHFFSKKHINENSNESPVESPRLTWRQAIKKLIASKDATRLLLMSLCVLYACFYLFRLFSVDYFSRLSIASGSEIFSNAQIVFMVILRFFTQAFVPIFIVVGYFKIKTLNTTVALLGTLVSLLNILFFKWNLIAFEGADFSYFSFRAIEFAFEIAIGLTIGAIYLYNKIKTKDFNKQTIIESLIGLAVVIGIGLIAMQPSTPSALFGDSLPEAKGFNFTHRMCLYMILIAGITLHFSIRKRPDNIKYSTCLLISISGIIAFFITYTWNIPLTALPLHLCNAALIVGLFALIFRSKKLFYFTYFVNVLGALFALLMPDTTGSILGEGNMRFWLTHISVVLVPLLAVGWDVFPRPNLKMMKNSIIVFSIYFVVACVSNMIISNYDPNVNYFFLQNDFFIEKFTFAYPIRANYTYTFMLGNLSLTVFPVYWLVIYIVYVATMFLMWLIYAYLYRVSDNFAEINKLKKIDRLDLLEFKKELDKNKDIKQNLSKEQEVIEINNFTKVYGNSATPAVENFSLKIEKGEVFGFLGHNGAGKSTLIKSMVGIQSITKGSIKICGYDIVHQPLEAKLHIGYVSDNHALYEKLTGREYVNFIADLYLVDKKDRDARLEEYAKLFNLQNDIDRQIKGYSHGMKQKLTVIASIIHNPKVWILDEPLTGLDPMSCLQIKSLMRKKADEGNIVFFSSHVIEVVEKICDKIAIIYKGQLKGIFSLDDLEKKNISLEKLYMELQNAKVEGIDDSESELAKLNDSEQPTKKAVKTEKKPAKTAKKDKK